MKGLDTNILVRHITQDDPIQSPIASQLFEGIDEENPVFIGAMTLVELAWVLESAYQADKVNIEACIESILHTNGVHVQFADLALEALLCVYGKAKSDFSDAFIYLINQREGCTQTLTFDKSAAKMCGMTLLK